MGEIDRTRCFEFSAERSRSGRWSRGRCCGRAGAGAFVSGGRERLRRRITSQRREDDQIALGGGVEPAYSKLTIETPDGKVLAQGAVGKPRRHAN